MRALCGLLLTLLLMGCGGGGPTPLPIMPLPLTSAEAIAEWEARYEASTSLLVTDFVFVPPEDGSPRLRGHTSCGGTTCLTALDGYGAYRLSLLSPEALAAGGVLTTDEAMVDLHEADGMRFGTTRLTYTQQEDWIDFRTDVFSLRGWLDYVSIEVARATVAHGEIYWEGDTEVYTGERFFYARAQGLASESAPVDGAATWTGAMVGGVGVPGDEIGIAIRGQAALTYEFAAEQMDVALTNIQNADPAKHGVQGYPNLYWRELDVVDGRFGGGFAEDTIEGQFYGPNHEEVGGIFQRAPMLGAFGGKR